MGEWRGKYLADDHGASDLGRFLHARNEGLQEFAELLDRERIVQEGSHRVVVGFGLEFEVLDVGNHEDDAGVESHLVVFDITSNLEAV